MATPNNIMRAIIDATLDRSLREVEEDPQRSIRKLTDLGRKFSNGRFMDQVYALIQDLLRNDESPYYTAIEQLLRNTDRENLKQFFINIGYNSLTFGGKIIRGLEKRKTFDIPWCLTIRMDTSLSTSLNAADVEHLVRQGNRLGIYSFLFRCSGSVRELNPLLRCISTYSDSAFICMLPEGELTQTQLGAMSQCPNALFMLPASSPHSMKNSELLRKQKTLYGVYDCYSDQNAEYWLSDSGFESLLPYKSALIILASADGCPLKTRKKIAKYIRRQRTQPHYPFIPFDLRSDALDINRIVSERSTYLEILETGNVMTADDTVLEYRHTLSLEQLLMFALPSEQA